MEQSLTFHLAIVGQSRPVQLQPQRVLGRPANRIFVPPVSGKQRGKVGDNTPAAPELPASRPVLRLQPIVSRPLQPYMLRESACGFLECRSAGRRCIASEGRAIELGYQVAYCLGARHAACPAYASATGMRRTHWGKRAVYTLAAIIMIGLVVAAVVEALGPGTPVELGRAVGLG